MSRKMTSKRVGTNKTVDILHTLIMCRYIRKTKENVLFLI